MRALLVHPAVCAGFPSGSCGSASLLAAAAVLLLQFPLLAKIVHSQDFEFRIALVGENCVHVSMCVCTSVHWKEEDRIF